MAVARHQQRVLAYTDMAYIGPYNCYGPCSYGRHQQRVDADPRQAAQHADPEQRVAEPRQHERHEGASGVYRRAVFVLGARK